MPSIAFRIVRTIPTQRCEAAVYKRDTGTGQCCSARRMSNTRLSCSPDVWLCIVHPTRPWRGSMMLPKSAMKDLQIDIRLTEGFSSNEGPFCNSYGTGCEVRFCGHEDAQAHRVDCSARCRQCLHVCETSEDSRCRN